MCAGVGGGEGSEGSAKFSGRSVLTLVKKECSGHQDVSLLSVLGVLGLCGGTMHGF